MNRQHFASHASRPPTAGARRPLVWLWVLLVWTLLAGPSSALAGSAPPRFEGKVEADVSLKVDRHGWRRNTAVVVFAVDGDRWSMTDDGGERFGGRVSRGHKKNRY